MRQIEVNLAYLWCLGLNFDETVPPHSTMMQIYKRKFKDSDIFEKIFSRILKIAQKSGYVDTEIIYVDATHIKANANKRKYTEKIESITSIKAELLEDINEVRSNLGKSQIQLEDDSLEVDGTKKEDKSGKKLRRCQAKSWT